MSGNSFQSFILKMGIPEIFQNQNRELFPQAEDENTTQWRILRNTSVLVLAGTQQATPLY